MKYLLLVCWDAERMNGQAEPEPGSAPAEDDEGFPWLNDLQARESDRPATNWRRPTGSLGARARREEDGDRRSVRRHERGGRRVRPDRGRRLEEAVEIAAKHPIAEMGTIEVDHCGEADVTVPV